MGVGVGVKGVSIATVAERLGAKKTKMLPTRVPLLRVLPEFVEYMSTIDDDALWAAIENPEKRKCLVEVLGR